MNFATYSFWGAVTWVVRIGQVIAQLDLFWPMRLHHLVDFGVSVELVEPNRFEIQFQFFGLGFWISLWTVHGEG